MWVKGYYNDIEKYKKKLIKRKIVHQYRDGLGNLLSDGFDLKKYQIFKINPPHSKPPYLIWKVKTRLKRILA